MSQATETYGAVLAGASSIQMARVAYADGSLVAPSEIASAEYTVSRRDGCFDADPTPVAGHDGVSIAPSDVLFATLQTDAAWDADATGYNFRHELDVGTGAAFPTPGAYQVLYTLTPSTGQPILIRFSIEAI